MMDSRQRGANKAGKSGLKKKGRIRRVLERVFTYLWALVSILLILTAIYLALKGNGR